MRPWQSYLAIGKGRPFLQNGSRHIAIQDRQYHATVILEAQNQPAPEGIAFTASNFNNSQAPSRRERSAAVSQNIQSLNRQRERRPSEQAAQPFRINRIDNGNPRPSNSSSPQAGGRYPQGDRPANVRHDTASPFQPRRVNSSAPPTAGRYPQGDRQAYIRRDTTSPSQPGHVNSSSPPTAGRYPQGDRPAYIRRDTTSPGQPGPPRPPPTYQRTFGRPPPAAFSGNRSSQLPPRNSSARPAPRRPRRGNRRSDDSDVADFSAPLSTTTDVPSPAQARRYLHQAAAETGARVPFAPARPELQQLVGMPMGLYATARGGGTRAVLDGMRVRGGGKKEEAVEGTTGLAARLLAGREVWLGDGPEREEVLGRARGLAAERARAAERNVKVGVQEVAGFVGVEEGVRKELVKKAVEDVKGTDFVARARGDFEKTVAGFLDSNGTYGAESGEVLMKKVKELLPVATRQGGQVTRQARR
ncbi:MAG: hypothetical protein M1821_008465 [Bathelium mastoideum]|nr:MAG: hypothetical protein M1821_008465 [Bathelium mastoideum]